MAIWSRTKDKKLDAVVGLVDAQGRPNLNALADVAKNVRLIELNLKAFGYDLARRMTEALPVRTDTVARHVGLRSKASTQEDIESDWVAHWSAQLKTAVIYHRKLWEFGYVLQALYERGHLVPNVRGLGFGCGVEPIPSYLASCGVLTTVTDLPRDAAQAKGWIDTNQHVAALESAFLPHLVDRATFDIHVDFREADMNAIPASLQNYDFCWSICALEHLGSIQQGLDFVETALSVLRPGGTAVHTMELNVDETGPTIDNWMTVLFQRKHLEALAQRLRSKGHQVAELDFNMGDKPMDKFIDLPPWSHDLPADVNARLGDPRHLKVGIDGFVATCFGIIVTKGG